MEWAAALEWVEVLEWEVWAWVACTAEVCMDNSQVKVVFLKELKCIFTSSVRLLRWLNTMRTV